MSLLEIGEGVVEVKATSGDNHLGGDDWDSRVVEWMVKKFKDANGVDLGADKIAKQRLQEAAEKAKIELSSSPETAIHLPYITHGESGPLHFEEKLTRAEFQKLTASPPTCLVRFVLLDQRPRQRHRDRRLDEPEHRRARADLHARSLPAVRPAAPRGVLGRHARGVPGAADIFLDNDVPIEAAPSKHAAAQGFFLYGIEPGATASRSRPAATSSTTPCRPGGPARGRAAQGHGLGRAAAGVVPLLRHAGRRGGPEFVTLAHDVCGCLELAWTARSSSPTQETDMSSVPAPPAAASAGGVPAVPSTVQLFEMSSPASMVSEMLCAAIRSRPRRPRGRRRQTSAGLARRRTPRALAVPPDCAPPRASALVTQDEAGESLRSRTAGGRGEAPPAVLWWALTVLTQCPGQLATGVAGLRARAAAGALRVSLDHPRRRELRPHHPPIHGGERSASRRPMTSAGATVVDVGATAPVLATLVARYPHMEGVLFDLPSVSGGSPLDATRALRPSAATSSTACQPAATPTCCRTSSTTGARTGCRRSCGTAAPPWAPTAGCWSGDGGAVRRRDAPGEDARRAHARRRQTGMERTEAQYAELLDRSGFRLERVVPTASAVSIVEAVPAWPAPLHGLSNRRHCRPRSERWPAGCWCAEDDRGPDAIPDRRARTPRRPDTGELAAATGLPERGLYRLLRVHRARALYARRRRSLRPHPAGRGAGGLARGRVGVRRVGRALPEALETGRSGMEIAHGMSVFEFFEHHPEAGAKLGSAHAGRQRRRAEGGGRGLPVR